MKNLKKVLAMVLAFACTFTMFASAKMYEDVQPGTEFSEAITMLSDLGVIQGKTDNKYHPEDTITRAEACMLITRLMTGDPTAAGFGGAHHFKDVPAGHWASSAIGYCVVNGVAVGVDAAGTKFEPNRPIKDKEFVTMVVRALGYETPDMKQNFPFGYMSAARAIGLLEDVNMIPDTDALRGEDAQVIYNAMFADYARGAKRTNVAHGTSVETYPTLAESIWHLNRAALGTWNKKDNEDVTLSNCKAHTWVILGEAQDEENALLALAIDDNEDTDLYKSEEKKHQYKAYKFKYEGTADIDALRGYKVELWGAGKHGEPVWEKDGEKFVYSNDWKIKAIKTVKNQTKFDYNPSMADRKSKDGSIELNEETKLSLGSAADNAKLVKQEQGVKEVVTFAADELNTIKVKDGDALEEALNVRNGMQYQLIDWNNDKEIDWVVVDEARYYKVESATSKRVNVTSMAGDNLKSDKDSVTETWKLDGSEKIGKNLADKDVKIKYEVPEGLKEGDIVEVTYKVTYDGAQMITATAKVVDTENEKLEEVGTKDGLTLTFGDKELKVAQNARKDGGDVIVPANPQAYEDFNGEELGTEFAVTKNRNGFIVYSDYATESSNYMMVLNTYGGKDTTGNRDLAVIDFVDANNTEHKDVKVSSSARVLDKDGNTLSTQHNNAYDKRKFDEAQVVGNVFKYWTDADGVITKMQAVFTADDAKADSAKESYKYDADADRLIDKNTKYVASLEDANVIFAVKEGYIKGDNNGGVFRTDLKVNSADVLATKQKDIPDIGYGDTTNKELLPDSNPSTFNAWLGSNKDNDNHFVVNLNKNNEATAAVLGVDNFNKFNAGSTKLGLVTNVSERNGGTIKAEVAFDGKVETIASAEKQDFEDIVKVFDGQNDQDVTGVDATISAAGNGVFHGKKLSTVVNKGGQYAEITTDADGKLTKLVFLDDDTTKGNQNKLQGHYYSVSRNLVLNVSDKNLKYNLNNNETYHDVVAAQYFASSDDLYTVGRLEASSAGYADEAKFYEITAKPSRHDRDYAGTQLSVNAGFDDLDQRDIKVAEKNDIDFNEQFYNTKKNIYEIADLAFNSDDKLVAVYSFDAMDEQDTKGIVQFKNGNPKASYDAGDALNMTAGMMDGTAVPPQMGYAVFNENGNNVSNLFTISGGTITVKTETPNGVYYVRLLDRDYKPMPGSYKFVVGNTTTTNPINITKVDFVDAQNSPSNTAYISKDGHSFDIKVTTTSPVTRAAVNATLTKDNIDAYDDGVRLNVTDVVAKATTDVYTVTVAETIAAGSQMKVSVIASKNIQVNGQTTGNVVGTATDTQVTPDAPVVVADGAQLVNVDGEEQKEVYPAKEIYFQLTKGGKPLETQVEKVSILGANGFSHKDVTVEGSSTGMYMITNKTASNNVPAGTYYIGINGVKDPSLKITVSDNSNFAFTVGGQSANANSQVDLALGTAELAIAGTGVQSVKLEELGSEGSNLTGKVELGDVSDGIAKKLIIKDVNAAISANNKVTVVATMKDGSEKKVVVTVTTKKHALTTFEVSASKSKKTEVRVKVDDEAIAKKLAGELQTNNVTVKSGSAENVSSGTDRACSAIAAEGDTIVLTIAEFQSDSHVGVKFAATNSFEEKNALANGVAAGN